MKSQKSQAKKCPRKLGSNLKIWRVYLCQQSYHFIDLFAKNRAQAIKEAANTDIEKFQFKKTTQQLCRAELLKYSN